MIVAEHAGAVLSNLRAISSSRPTISIQIPIEDVNKMTNGGQHPWQVGDGHRFSTSSAECRRRKIRAGRYSNLRCHRSTLGRLQLAITSQARPASAAPELVSYTGNKVGTVSQAANDPSWLTGVGSLCNHLAGGGGNYDGAQAIEWLTTTSNNCPGLPGPGGKTEGSTFTVGYSGLGGNIYNTSYPTIDNSFWDQP